jgi:hypothetical protein
MLLRLLPLTSGRRDASLALLKLTADLASVSSHRVWLTRAACEAVLDCMRRHSGDRLLQLEACRALESLADQNLENQVGRTPLELTRGDKRWILALCADVVTLTLTLRCWMASYAAGPHAEV